MRLLDFIPTGRGNALSARELAALMRCNVRDITRWVEQARKQGVPICADGSGFWLPENKQELERYVLGLRNRIDSVAGTLQGAERALEGWTDDD